MGSVRGTLSHRNILTEDFFVNFNCISENICGWVNIMCYEEIDLKNIEKNIMAQSSVKQVVIDSEKDASTIVLLFDWVKRNE